MLLESALLFETVEEIYSRVFRRLRPKLPVPQVRVEYRAFTNLTSNIRLLNGVLLVRISDLLEQAPSHVQEALAHILVSKLFRERPPSSMMAVYRHHLSRQEIRGSIHQVRQERGYKRLDPPQGDFFDLDTLFNRINSTFFEAKLPKPRLGWSPLRSRTILGHYDAAHHSITISRRLDHASVPAFVVDYVMFHEMLHIKHPVEHHAGGRKIHTRAFKQEEKSFPFFQAAKIFLKSWR